MTKAEEKAKLEKKQHEREVLVSRGKLVMIVVCLVAIPVTFWWNHREANDVRGRIARVESPCLKASEEPTSKNKRLCRESFEKAVLTITHPEACAIERKAGTLKALRELAHQLDVNFREPCKGARLAQELERSKERAATERASTAPTAEGGDASNAQPGSSQPGPSTGGSNEGATKVGGHEGGHKKSPEKLPPSGGGHETPSAPPTSPPSESPPSTPSSQTTERKEPVAEPPAEPPGKSAAGGLVEDVGKALEPAEEAVGGTVETVTGKACELTGLLCSK